MKSVGSRTEVMHGMAKHTSGGLTKSKMKYKSGRIVSRKVSSQASKRLKSSPFGAFVKFAKKQKSFKLVPKKGTKQYKKLVK